MQGALSVGARILLSAVFIMAGLSKIADPTGTAGYIGSVGIPLPSVAVWVAILVEVAGGAMLLVGFKAKYAAAALAVFTVVATAFFHNNFADQIQMLMFMKNLAITGGLLIIVREGAGPLSVDARSMAPAPAAATAPSNA